MTRINPLYLDYIEEDSVRGSTNLYLDTQIVNYMRKGDSEEANILRTILSQSPFAYKLYFSAAHLGDYLRDTTNLKDDDLRFMGELGMINYIAYDEYKRRSISKIVLPIHMFYYGRMNAEQVSQVYRDNRKPRLDQDALNLFDWFKETLIEFEKDKSYLSTLDPKDADTFLDFYREVNLNSDELTPESYLKQINEYWKNVIFKMTDKDASRYLLNANRLDRDILQYADETFDLSKPNITDQIQGTYFHTNLIEFIKQSLYNSGLNLSDNYDELALFTRSYFMMQILGVEIDKRKKYNARSTTIDAGHFYFASMCNYLITEDDGLYRRAKVLYGVLGVTTKVFRISEFIAQHETAH